jgi:HTH-type transcriptional repressor of NAD biosynthesis genes
MKQYKQGLVLGKFLDFHKGHIKLIRDALSVCDEVIVLICEGERDRTTMSSRNKWIYETFGNDIVISHVNCADNSLPEDGESDRGISAKWATFLDNRFPNLDVVIGSEAYIIFMSDVGSFDGRIFDLARTLYPCSSTSVSNGDPQWRAPAGSIDVGLRVGFIGPESCGKSTAAAMVDDNFIDEQARWMMGDDHYDFNDLERFALAQQLEVLDSAKDHRNLTIVDSTAITTWVYSAHKFGKVSQIVMKIAEFEPIDHYLLFSPEVPMVQDGTRLQDQDSREKAFWCYEDLLITMNKPYTIITGSDYSQRVDQVKSKLKELKNA